MPTADSKTPVYQAASTATLQVQVVDKNRRPQDLSSATRKQIVVVKPKGGGRIVKTLSLLNDGTDGWLTVTFDPKEVKEPGTYSWQLDLAFGSWDGPTASMSFECLRNL